MNRREFLKTVFAYSVVPGAVGLAAKLAGDSEERFDPDKVYGYVVYFWNINGMQDADDRAHAAMAKFIPEEYHAKCSFRYKQPHPSGSAPYVRQGYVAVKYDPKRTPWRQYA